MLAQSSATSFLRIPTIRAAITVAFLLLSQRASATPGCPNNFVDLYTGGADIFINTTDAMVDSMQKGVFSRSAHASYNLVSGRLQGSVGVHGNIIIETADIFTLTGPPAGTPVALQARMYVRAVVGVSPGFDQTAGCEARIQDSPTNYRRVSASVRARFPPYAVQLDTTLVLPIVAVAGQPFQINMYLSAETRWGGGFTADTAGEPGVSLSFAGLPPGASLVSCQGFTVESPILVEPTTWSRIKTRFRTSG
jgi:hypothetical protein